MKLNVTNSLKPQVDTLLVYCYDSTTDPLGDFKFSKDLFKLAFKNENFTASNYNTITFYPKDGKPAKRIICAAIGKKASVTLESLRRATYSLVSRAKSLKISECTLVLPDLKFEPQEISQAVSEAIYLSVYQFNKYKSKPDENKLGQITFISKRKGIEQGQKKGFVYARATCLTRDLVNEPAGVMTPIKMAEIATKIAKEGKIEITVLDEKQIEKLSMGAFRAVSIGSEQPPRFVHMKYQASGAKKTIAILGKGITYDSGGLCLKTADQMLNMKNDMSGAAAVIGIFSALKELKPKVDIHGIFPATENMPGGAAYKQRDILKTMGGKTIEVTNTDAEGRLVLSDALVYASRLKPDCIIDMATLTGAIVVALGSDISGVFSTDKKLAKNIIECGETEGEKIWEMPLEEEYFTDGMSSDIADMKNAGGNPGSIQGANFLKQFVDDGIPWAHIDIAGTAMRDKAKFYNGPGGTGAMVRTMLRFLEQQAI